MVEYIDKNKAIELIKELENIKDVSEAEEWVDIFITTINELPIIELKHGQWVATEKGAKITAYKCSECGRVVWDDTGYDVSKDYPYCHCGAKMNEDAEDGN